MAPLLYVAVALAASAWVKSLLPWWPTGKLIRSEAADMSEAQKRQSMSTALVTFTSMRMNLPRSGVRTARCAATLIGQLSDPTSCVAAASAKWFILTTPAPAVGWAIRVTDDQLVTGTTGVECNPGASGGSSTVAMLSDCADGKLCQSG